MIYTSYFANWRKFPEDSVKVAVCRLTPANFKGYQFQVVAPSLPLLGAFKNGYFDKKEYTEHYLSQLRQARKLGKLDKFVEYLKSQEKDVVLLCYEKKDAFCHRTLLAEFLNKEYGMVITEL